MKRGNVDFGRSSGTSERGQALVEFALVLPLLLLVVIGMLEFGKAINYWIDQNQLASEGARWVVVNRVPSGSSLNTNPSVTDYKTYIQAQAETQELRNLAVIKICAPSGTAPGGSVRVRLSSSYNLIPILKIASVSIKSSATMRIEQKQTNTSVAFDAAAQCP